MKRLLILLGLVMMLTLPAAALEYTMEAPDDYLFGRPTSDDTIYEWENPNVDRSKNAALLPPGLGTPESYLPGSGEPLTPNLIAGGTGGGLVSQVGSVTYSNVSGGGAGTAFTAVTSDLYYSGGHLGTLEIPAIGLRVKIYQGTDDAALKNGVGHFTESSIWDGNVALAGHNRGVNTYFGQIHTLDPGDTIRLTTKHGVRTYHVSTVSMVQQTDQSGLLPTTNHVLTLYTCVRDQPTLRWCVRAELV